MTIDLNMLLTVGTPALVTMVGAWLVHRQKAIEAAATSRATTLANQVAVDQSRTEANTLLIDQLQEQVAEQRVEAAKMRAEISALYTEVSVLRTRSTDLIIGVKKLTSQLVSLDLEPAWSLTEAGGL